MKITTSKKGGAWTAILTAEPPDDFLQTSAPGLNKSEAIRLATEAYEDLVAPLKTCRGPEHQGPRELPKTLRHFRQEGKRVLRDGAPLLRHVCRVCEAAWQARYFRKVRAPKRKALAGR